jgi:hypothetical protein
MARLKYVFCICQDGEKKEAETMETEDEEQKT